MQLIVTEIKPIATNTVCVRFAAAKNAVLSEFKPGAHIEITIGGLQRRYSLTSSRYNPKHYEICVLHTMPSRGGSVYIHKVLKIGDTVAAEGPFNAFALNTLAKHSVFIAGGIGVTPFISMMEALLRDEKTFELHYAARDHDRFLPIPKFTDMASYYVKRDGRLRLDIDALLAKTDINSDLYVCGPRPLIESVRAKAAAHGWPSNAVHFESFGATQKRNDQAIKLTLAQSEMSIEVQPGTTILDALIENGVWATYECKRGECGSCVTEVISGDPDHRDFCLDIEQRKNTMCTCVSWAKSDTLTLNL